MMASNMLYSVRYVLVVIQLLILMRISRQDLVSSLIGGVVSTLIPPTNSQDVSSTKTTYSDAELEKNFGQGFYDSPSFDRCTILIRKNLFFFSPQKEQSITWEIAAIENVTEQRSRVIGNSKYNCMMSWGKWTPK